MDAAARVRGATVEDAAAIARVHIESHREAYVATGLIPGAVVEASPEAARAGCAPFARRGETRSMRVSAQFENRSNPRPRQGPKAPFPNAR